MYSRYMSDRSGEEPFEPVERHSSDPVLAPPVISASAETVIEAPSAEAGKATPQQAIPASGRRSILGNLFGRGDGRSGSGLFGGLFKGFNLSDLDIGDLLIIAILILLFLEDDDSDFLIVIGLIVLLGL